MGYTATQTLLVGAHVITAELQSPTHVPLGPVATVNVVVNSAGIAFVTPTNGQVFTATNNVSLSIPIQITTTNFVIPTDGHWHLWVDGTHDRAGAGLHDHADPVGWRARHYR